MNDAQTLGFVIGVVLPLLVGLVTTRVTSSGVQAILLAVLSALNGFLSELLSPTFDLKTALLTWLGSFLIAVGTHYGFWKPVGLSARLQDVGSKKNHELAA